MTGDLKDILAIALPTLIPSLTILVGVISNNKRLDDMSGRINDLRSEMNQRLNDLRAEMNTRFDAMERLFDSKLRHMEDVIDARLKHLEEER